MPLWNRQKPEPPKPDRQPTPEPVPNVSLPELDELAAQIPERDSKGRFFRHEYVDRITERFDGLLIRADRLPRHVPVQPFDGTITIENGSHETGERER